MCMCCTNTYVYVLYVAIVDLGCSEKFDYQLKLPYNIYVLLNLESRHHLIKGSLLIDEQGPRLFKLSSKRTIDNFQDG